MVSASTPLEHNLARLVFGISMVLAIVAVSLGASDGSAMAAPMLVEPTLWTHTLASDACLYLMTNDCHYGSPVLADLNSDGHLDVIVVTNKGHITALKHDGSLLWDTDIAPYFGMTGGTHEIHSSPAVADVDNDGLPEIAVGAGTIFRQTCTQGGVIVLNHNGGIEPGWPFLAADGPTPPAGCRDTIFSSPGLGDLDNDGDLEIVTAGFDKRIYALHHDGTLLPGFPPDSYLYQRFPTWSNLAGKLADNTASSPALADFDGDGFLDIAIGTGEGNFDDRWGGDSGGWLCPYASPPGWAPGYCGGSLYVFDRFGNLLPGFPRYYLEAIGSTPAVFDVDGDGAHEIFFGTGNYYFNNSPDHPTFGLRLYAVDGNGNDLPGWTGGKAVSGGAPASPTIGDIAGDTEPEIVMASMDGKLYAWHVDGQPAAGFPMTPLEYSGTIVSGFDVGISFPLADVDGDDKMEILFSLGWDVVIVDGDGQQLTGTVNDTGPLYRTGGILQNTPAIGDLNNNGQLELVASNSSVYVWRLPNSSDKTDWPMFKQNAARTSAFPAPPRLDSARDDIFVLHQSGDPKDAKSQLRISNGGTGSFDWSADAPPGVTLSPSGGELTSDQSVVVTVKISTDGVPDGAHELGDISITATMDEGVVEGSPALLPVTLIVGEISHSFLPSVQQ